MAVITFKKQYSNGCDKIYDVLRDGILVGSMEHWRDVSEYGIDSGMTLTLESGQVVIDTTAHPGDDCPWFQDAKDRARSYFSD